ncbi:hypothetical protein [Virgibacillus doumboii]|uniref:hypothetical protein n=1 Tax=Virgibacillus doumboii TaxID=2697503 RepID=UPI0013E0590D|nr:hypothetical protein [Virgibacillus doumboii]
MNDKLWKAIQFGSFSALLLAFAYMIIGLPLEPIPDGGWKISFPSENFQIGFVVVCVALFLTWAFATFVRKQGEVSKKAVQSTIFFLVGFGIFFWILQLI